MTERPRLRAGRHCRRLTHDTEDSGMSETTARVRGLDSRRIALTVIRSLHSAIFLVVLSAIAWLVATGLMGRRDRSVAAAAALVAAESGVFIANRGVCPLTPLAERYGAQRGGVSDIFLPDIAARTIPVWATSLVIVGSAAHVGHWVVARREAPSRTAFLARSARAGHPTGEGRRPSRDRRGSDDAGPRVSARECGRS